MVKQSEHALEIARQQLASLASPEARAEFRREQQLRYNPGGGGYTYDKRGKEPTVEYAENVIQRCITALEARQSKLAELTLETIESRNDQILLAAADYPEDDGSRTYYNKKGQPKVRQLREHTNIYVTKAERNEIWEPEYEIELFELWLKLV